MPASFTLCADCAAQFQALCFDPKAILHSILMPYGSIVWDDELPPRDQRQYLGHRECNLSMIRLIGLRKQLWLSGSRTEPVNEVWEQARRLIPNWPGFQRLALNRQEWEALRFCEQETNDLVNDFRQSSAVFSVTDEGGGAVSFKSHPPTTPGKSPNQNEAEARGAP
jgi:hypothetical protein